MNNPDHLYNVNLMPIEPILFTDNRSARAGEDHLIQDQDPSPHTIYGAIGACVAGMYGVEVDEKQWEPVASKYLGKFAGNIRDGDPARSELLGYHYQDPDGHFWFPRPQHIRLRQPGKEKIWIAAAGRIEKLESELTAASLETFERFLNYEADDKECELPDLFSLDLLKDCLCGNIQVTELTPDSDRLPLEHLYRHENRLGLGMDYERNQTLTGRLFSRPYRRYSAQVDSNGNWSGMSIRAYFKTTAPLESERIKNRRIALLGGDRGRAIAEFESAAGEKPLLEICREVQQAAEDSDGFYLYLLTPAVREGDWPLIKGVKPLAAAIGKDHAVSGWNSNRQGQHPRPIRRLLPAGSVLFYPWPEGKPDPQLIHEYWLEPLTYQKGEHYRNSGFGRLLIGV
ncbi:MAG: hypothetical protein KDH97_15370, partial [Calditrichaeota bacterium]|nr:hypothetical protein [Calditrichota bacterium]